MSSKPKVDVKKLKAAQAVKTKIIKENQIVTK